MLPLDLVLTHTPCCFYSEMAHLPFVQDMPSQQGLHFKASLLLRQAENGSKGSSRKWNCHSHSMWYGGGPSCRLQLQDSMSPWPFLPCLQERATINCLPYALWFGAQENSDCMENLPQIFPLVSSLPIGQPQESIRKQHCHLSGNVTDNPVLSAVASPGKGRKE